MRLPKLTVLCAALFALAVAHAGDAKESKGAAQAKTAAPAANQATVDLKVTGMT